MMREGIVNVVPDPSVLFWVEFVDNLEVVPACCQVTTQSDVRYYLDIKAGKERTRGRVRKGAVESGMSRA